MAATVGRGDRRRRRHRARERRRRHRRLRDRPLHHARGGRDAGRAAGLRRAPATSPAPTTSSTADSSRRPRSLFMTRIAIFAAVALLALTGAAYSTAATADARSTPAKPTVVLVHGAFADASGSERSRGGGCNTTATGSWCRPTRWGICGRRRDLARLPRTHPGPDRPGRPLLRRRRDHERRDRRPTSRRSCTSTRSPRPEGDKRARAGLRPSPARHWEQCPSEESLTSCRSPVPRIGDAELYVKPAVFAQGVCQRAPGQAGRRFSPPPRAPVV